MPANDPVIDVSAGGGPSIPVIVDTGSKGLVVPYQDVPLASLLMSAVNPSNWVFGGYTGGSGGGLNYFGIRVPTTVTIGDTPAEGTYRPGQLTTGPTQVIAALVTTTPPQTWFEQLLHINHVESLHDYFLSASGGADGVLGIGPDAAGPGPVVTTALPGNLSDGEFIRINAATPQNSYIGFGRPIDLDLGGPVSTGAPITTVQVRINGGPPQTVKADFDSGGGVGSIPSSLVKADKNGKVPVGTTISVSTTNGGRLYTYTTTAGDTPTVTSDALFNTGITPFATAGFGDFNGIYISNQPSGGEITSP
jgi:hypothetical protein